MESGNMSVSDIPSPSRAYFTPQQPSPAMGTGGYQQPQPRMVTARYESSEYMGIDAVKKLRLHYNINKVIFQMQNNHCLTSL